MNSKEAQEAQEAELTRRGITYTRLDDGGILISKIPKEVQEVHSFFQLNKPCWFDGCEDLRKEYIQQTQKYNSGPECKTCERGQIMRQFIPRIEQALQRYNNDKHREVQRPMDESPKGT